MYRRAPLVAAVTTALLSAAPAFADPKAPPPPKPAAADPLPDPGVRIRLTAPSAAGLWIFRIDNEGPNNVRVPADARLLHLTVAPGDTVKASKPTACALPRGFLSDGFPERRGLILQPGESYIERFDPRLFCFGKALGMLAGSNLVQATFGWGAASKRQPKRAAGPFAVESIDDPAAVAPERMLPVPSIVLNFEEPEEDEAEVKAREERALKEEKAREERQKREERAREERLREAQALKGDKAKIEPPADLPPPPPVDENAARFELSQAATMEAASPSQLTISVTATNVGHRSALAVISPHNLTFRVQGPDGTTRCEAPGSPHIATREGYREYKPGASISMTLLLAEFCSRDAFRRPGLYTVHASLHLDDSGADLDLAAYTGIAHTRAPTLMRLLSAQEPFHRFVARAVKTPGDDGAALPPPGQAEEVRLPLSSAPSPRRPSVPHTVAPASKPASAPAPAPAPAKRKTR